jgi:hypothetical protein
MNNKDKEFLEIYDNLIESKINITKLYCLDCVETILSYIEKEVDDSTKLDMVNSIYNMYLETEDIQISKISDILVTHWQEFNENENFNIYDYEMNY